MKLPNVRPGRCVASTAAASYDPLNHGPKSMNDYDPAWDYTIDPKPDKRVVAIVRGLDQNEPQPEKDACSCGQH